MPSPPLSPIPKGEALYQAFRARCEKRIQNVGGIPLGYFAAYLMMKIADSLTPESREAYLSIPFPGIVDMTDKLLERS